MTTTRPHPLEVSPMRYHAGWRAEHDIDPDGTDPATSTTWQLWRPLEDDPRWKACWSTNRDSRFVTGRNASEALERLAAVAGHPDKTGLTPTVCATLGAAADANLGDPPTAQHEDP